MTAALLSLLLCGQYASDVDAAIADYAAGQQAGYEYRYLDFSAMDAAKGDRDELAVNFWLPHLSREQALGGQRAVHLPGTHLYRIDLDGLGWSVSGAWKKLASVYPYQHAENPLIIRADWLCWITADQESNKTTAYYDLLFDGKPPANKADWLKGLGIQENNKFAQAVLIDHRHSGVALHNRKLQASPTENGADFWQTFDVADDSGKQDPFSNPDGFIFDAQELIVGMPKVVDYAGGERCMSLAFFLCNGQGVRAEFAPTTIANDKSEFLRNPSVRTPGSCVQCHGAYNGASESLIRDSIRRGTEITVKEKRAKAAFEALYLGDLGKRLERGNEDYQDLGTLHLGQEIDLARKAWTALVTDYDAPLTMNRAARELLCEPETLRNAIAYYSELVGPSSSARLADLAHGGSVSRRQWHAEVYHQARKALETWKQR